MPDQKKPKERKSQSKGIFHGRAEHAAQSNMRGAPGAGSTKKSKRNHGMDD